MQDLVDALEPKLRASYLLDTCFLFHILEHDRLHELESFCEKNDVAMTSFNLSEVVFKHHLLHGVLNHHLRGFFKRKLIKRIDTWVKPGEREQERLFVESFDRRLMEIVRDPSDAVILVEALKLKADILTRDKHHIFTTKAENFLHDFGIKVLNDLP